jgi:predicted nucleic acid-binding protein
VIILDTNVLPALMRREPDRRVLDWLDRQAAPSLWLTSVTVFESRLGLALLPAGRRRQALAEAFEQMLVEDFEKRVLAFDAAAAVEAAAIAAVRQHAGQVVDIRDTLIAGIAAVRRATIATRNLHHFEGLTTPAVSPWN